MPDWALSWLLHVVLPLRYITFKIQDNQIVLDKAGGPNETYDDFTASLPETDCRYCVYDYDFTTEDNCNKSKIFFIAW